MTLSRLEVLETVAFFHARSAALEPELKSVGLIQFGCCPSKPHKRHHPSQQKEAGISPRSPQKKLDLASDLAPPAPNVPYCELAMKRAAPLILLIEQEELLAEVTAFRLELLGYCVAIVPSLAKAWTSMEQEQPDLIIYDLATSDGNGLDFLNQARAKETTANIPILIFSTDSELTNVQRAHRAGASDYLVTPFDPAVLEHKVEHLLGGDEEEQPVQSPLARLLSMKF